jgi:hypothetical protein
MGVIIIAFILFYLVLQIDKNFHSTLNKDLTLLEWMKGVEVRLNKLENKDR